MGIGDRRWSGFGCSLAIAEPEGWEFSRRRSGCYACGDGCELYLLGLDGSGSGLARQQNRRLEIRVMTKSVGKSIFHVKAMFNGLPALLCLAGLSAWAETVEATGEKDTAAPAWTEDFEQVEIGAEPENFFILEGDFQVKEVEGNRVLSLASEPLGEFGVIFGPRASGNAAVRARVKSSAAGRRRPNFAVGLNGRAGYRLRVSAGAHRLELLKGEKPVASATCKWTSESWTWLHLRIAPDAKGGWPLEGKVWTEGEPEPSGWAISWREEEKPPAGQASLWGSPFSGKAIHFDDLSVKLP